MEFRNSYAYKKIINYYRSYESSCNVFDAEVNSIGGRYSYTDCKNDNYIFLSHPLIPIIDLIDIHKKLHEECGDYNFNVYVDFINNPAYNAKAFKNENKYFIGLFIGLVFILRDYFYTIMSDSLWFDVIGNASKEEKIDNLNWVKEGYSCTNFKDIPFGLLYHKVPKDHTRGAFAGIMLGFAYEFLTYHEFGHIYHGHLDYLQENQSIFAVSESVNKIREATERHLLEIDADIFAITSLFLRLSVSTSLSDMNTDCFIGIKSPEIVNARAMTDPDFTLFCWFFAVYSLFKIFDIHNLPLINYKYYTHPHPMIRIRLIEERILEVCEEAYNVKKYTVSNILERAILMVESIWSMSKLSDFEIETRKKLFKDSKLEAERYKSSIKELSQKIDCYKYDPFKGKFFK